MLRSLPSAIDDGRDNLYEPNAILSQFLGSASMAFYFLFLFLFLYSLLVFPCLASSSCLVLSCSSCLVFSCFSCLFLLFSFIFRFVSLSSLLFHFLYHLLLFSLYIFSN